VLTSQWSAVFGIPVSAPAALLYAAVFIASFFIGTLNLGKVRRLAWGILFVAAVTIACSAMWFIAVQAFILKAFCIWCMTDHVIGLLLAGLILWKDPFVKPSVGSQEPIATQLRRVIVLTTIGTLLTLTLVVTQFVAPYRGPAILRLEPGKNADTGPGPDRRIAVIDGNLQLIVSDEAVLGSPDANTLVVVMFDYCCPHCRRTHEFLLHALDHYPGQLGIVCLPLPLDADCNTTIEKTEPRFEHACDLARLALAVRKVDAAVFAEYDQWLFAPEIPPDPQEARAKAEQMVDPNALTDALKAEEIDSAIARHVKAYEQSGAERIPLIMSPGFASIVGRPDSEEQLFEMFETDLLLRQKYEPQDPEIVFPPE